MTQLDAFEFSTTYSAQKQRRSGLLLLLLAALVAVLGLAAEVPRWLVVGEFVIVAAIGVVGFVCAHVVSHQEPVLRLDVGGVTVGSGPLIPWDDLSEVRLMSIKPSLVFGGRRHRVVGFMPTPGRQLPALPGVGGRTNNRARRYRERFYGTNLLVMVDTVTASAHDVAEAARRIGGLPVTAEPLHPVRRWVVVCGIGIGVAAGLVIPAFPLLLLR